MGLKRALPVLKIRRDPVSAGRKLANKGDERVVASEMCGYRLPTIICPSVSSPPACPVLLAVPLPQGSQSCSNRAPAPQERAAELAWQERSGMRNGWQVEGDRCA